MSELEGGGVQLWKRFNCTPCPGMTCIFLRTVQLSILSEVVAIRQEEGDRTG